MSVTSVEKVKNKCLFKCVRRKRISPVVMCHFVTLCTAVAVLLVSPALAATVPKDKDTADISCSSLRYTYEERGLSVGDVPKDPLSGNSLNQ